MENTKHICYGNDTWRGRRLRHGLYTLLTCYVSMTLIAYHLVDIVGHYTDGNASFIKFSSLNVQEGRFKEESSVHFMQ